MTTGGDVEALKPVFGPGLALICVWLAIGCLQQAMVARFMIASGALGTGIGMFVWLFALAMLGMFLTFFSAASIILTRSRFAIYLAIFTVIYCGPWANYVKDYLAGFPRPLDSVSYGPLWDILHIVDRIVPLIVLVYLLVSKRVAVLYGTATREMIVRS